MERREADPNFSVKEAYEKLEKINANLEHSFKALTQPTHIIADKMKRMIEMDSNGGNAGNVNNVTNNRNVQPVINVGDVNVTCPGVTSQEVMREVGDALGKQIGHLSQRAIQEQLHDY